MKDAYDRDLCEADHYDGKICGYPLNDDGSCDHESEHVQA